MLGRIRPVAMKPCSISLVRRNTRSVYWLSDVPGFSILFLSPAVSLMVSLTVSNACVTVAMIPVSALGGAFLRAVRLAVALRFVLAVDAVLALDVLRALPRTLAFAFAFRALPFDAAFLRAFLAMIVSNP